MPREQPATDVAPTVQPYPKVFVVGCPRSGTTWARSILQAHDDVVSGDESHVFDVLYRAVAAARRNRRWRENVLARFDERAALAETTFGNAGPQRWVERGVLEHLVRRISGAAVLTGAAPRLLIGGIFDAFFMANGGGHDKMLVEKTPRHLMYARQILAWWPEARCVEVVRDGRDVCVSLEHKSKLQTWAAADRAEQVDRWVEAIRTGSELRSNARLVDRWHLVRYEDLSDRPDQEVRRLYDFVGLRHDTDTIDRVVASTAFARAQQPGNKGHLRNGMVGDWRNHFSAEDLRLFNERAGNALIAMGYR